MMRITANKRAPSARGIFSPLRHAVFRRIWTASLLSNLGILVLGVGAAWTMTQISSSTDMVALVQTSLMLPVALVSTPAGAIADMFDRRIVGLVALSIALAGSISLSALAWLGVVTPALLLVSCFIIGSGMALFGPAWQASVSEQVPAEALPSAVALNGISYNIARSFGPAIGGIIVASAGAVAAFATNALLYLPLLIVLFLWRRVKEPSRLPPERMARAVISGVRYIVHSPPIRIVLGRTLVTGIAGGSVSALMPIVTRDLLHGGAQTYGVMLGAFGMGAVIGALNISTLRGRLGDEVSIRLCMIVMGVCVAVVAISRSPAAVWKRARLRGRRLDRFGHGVQCRRSTCRAALGRRSRAGGLPGGHFRWDCARQLGVGQHSKRHWGRGSAAHFGRNLACLAVARLVDADADGQRAERAVP